jgi:hypothetical protein
MATALDHRSSRAGCPQVTTNGGTGTCLVFAMTAKNVNLPDVVHLTVVIHILASFLKSIPCAFRVSSIAFLFLAAPDSEATCFAFDMLVTAQERFSV